jgi:hypothetical protein
MLSVPYAVRSATAAQADNATNATNALNAEIASVALDSIALGGVASSNYARVNVLNTGNFQTSGNVGFGTVAPNTRLTLSGGPLWTSSQWTASMNMQNDSALGWEANSTGQRFGIGQWSGGLRFFRTISGFGSTLTPAEDDLQITNNGDIAQPVERNGIVKAMLFVVPTPAGPTSGAIVRCYNGVTGTTAGDCGFSLGGVPGLFYVYFPFQVNNRFAVATVDTTGVSATSATVDYEPAPTNVLLVRTFDGELVEPAAFTLIVY